MTRDWEEDMKHINGLHTNICRVCGETFMGFKRRCICFVCVNGSGDEH